MTPMKMSKETNKQITAAATTTTRQNEELEKRIKMMKNFYLKIFA